METVQPIFPDQYEFTLITIYTEFSVEYPSFELTLFPGHSFANVQSVSGQVAGKGDSDNPCKQKEKFPMEVFVPCPDSGTLTQKKSSFCYHSTVF